MERSLSIVLPVHNAQSTLAHDVTRLLDAASELTPQLEVLIMDDGSSDHTVEIAEELAVRYPQVRVCRHAKQRGTSDLIQTGFEQTRGEIVCVHQGEGRVDVATLRQLWQRRNDPDLVVARHPRAAAAKLNRLTNRWVRHDQGRRSVASSSAFQMLRRSSLVDAQMTKRLIGGDGELRLNRADIHGPSGPRVPAFSVR